MPPSDPPRLSLLQRREIEARIVGPLVRAYARELGQERALEVLREVTEQLARNSGAALAHEAGDTSLTAFASVLDRWTEGGALELDVLEKTEDHLDFNVTRCRYAELYRSLGLVDLGAGLSCCRDGALVEGFNPDIELSRTQTIMEGAPFCNFRFSRRTDPKPGSD